MKVKPCPFCGHNLCVPEKFDSGEEKFVRIRCYCCDAFKIVKCTGDDRIDRNNIITEWNKRIVPETELLDIKLKKIQIKEKELEIKARENVIRSAERSDILSTIKDLRGTLDMRDIHTEPNTSGTEMEFHIDKVWSDMDQECIKDKIRVFTNKLN